MLVMSQVVLVIKNPSAKAGDVRSRRLNCKTHLGKVSWRRAGQLP